MTSYQALINLSVPRRGDKDKQCDLVMAGETVELDDEIALQFLRHDDRSGRQVEVIRRAGGGDVPRVLPRMVSGRLTGPPQGVRPDPEGSSRVQVLEIPEANEPQPDTETRAAEDAVDIPPSRSRSRARAGAG